MASSEHLVHACMYTCTHAHTQGNTRLSMWKSVKFKIHHYKAFYLLDLVKEMTNWSRSASHDHWHEVSGQVANKA